jgi:glycosyltransferase involved in cell wall biosynthesis
MTDSRTAHRISFIIPVLNGQQYIGRCLDSILKEMHDDDELIVVDNGSADDTLSIVAQYDAVKSLVFPSVTIAALRNRGASVASGDVLTFIDSDCLVCEGWRAAAQSALNDELVKVTGSTCIVPPSGSWIEKAWWPSGKLPKTEVSYIASANFVISRDVFDEVSGFNEELITDEDTEICSRIIKLGYRIIFDPEIRAIHLDNARTLREFVKKEKWHATSIMSTLSEHGIDRPMIMTLAFMLCVLSSVVSLPFVALYDLSPAYPIALILLVPTLTALYRVIQRRRARYFLHLSMLYLVFYCVRAVTVVEAVLKGGRQKPG